MAILTQNMKKTEEAAIKRALKKAKGNISQAAKLMDVDRMWISYRLKKRYPDLAKLAADLREKSGAHTGAGRPSARKGKPVTDAQILAAVEGGVSMAAAARSLKMSETTFKRRLHRLQEG